MKEIRHVGLILDGTRRWARKNGVPVNSSGIILIKKMDEILTWIKDINDDGYNIKYLSAYAYSIDNLKRDEGFKHQLFDAMDWGINHLIKKYEKDFRIVIGGTRKKIDKKYMKVLEEVENRTKDNRVIVNIAMCYDGKQEICDAVEKFLKSETVVWDWKNFNPNILGKYLYFDDVPIDLIIRTGYEKRLSGFMPWYSTYSELFFLDCLSIDFTKEMFLDVLEEFFKRDRRFGI